MKASALTMVRKSAIFGSMDGKILILEDDQPFAEMLAETLDANDFPAEISLDPQDALQRVREEDFSLLVSDYLMPKLEGTAFIRQVREFDKSIPVLMISAYMGEAEMKQASEAGVSRVLRKPFEMKDLMDEIRQLLEEVRPAGEDRSTGGSAKMETDFPQPLRFLPPVSGDSSEFLQRLWEGFVGGGPLFLTGERGFEVDLIAAELSVWGDAEGGTISFDFDVEDLLSQKVRPLLSRFAGKDRYSRVVIGRNIDQLDRSEQSVLRQALERADSFLRMGGKLNFVFPIEEQRLSLAEMSMDEGLLEMIFGNLVRVPPLKGRYRDIAHYLKRFAESAEGPRLDRGAVSYLLRYEWPGNYFQLREFCNRLVSCPPAKDADAGFVRSTLEKRLDYPLEETGEPGLRAVLRERQTEFLRTLSKSRRVLPEKVLKEAGCIGVEPVEDFPDGQDLLFPELLEPKTTG